MMIFARVSKSIVDTLAKHWTTTRGAEIVALSVVSTQLLDKQQKHQKFLQFLALSKCHEELSSRQSMITDYYDFLVGEKARQNTVLLMDRGNAEVFYSKVSELEEVFHCLEKKLSLVVSEYMPFTFQLQRTCELSSMCVSLLNTSMTNKDENQMWYPSPEGLTPGYCQTVVIADNVGDNVGDIAGMGSDLIAKVQVLEREIGLLQLYRVYNLISLGERSVRCYAVVAIVVVATQTYVAHAVRRQKTAVAVTTKGKHVLASYEFVLLRSSLYCQLEKKADV
ncbi:nucleoporin, Nup133/Nup155-like protein [Artemisia annua]|uniref:H(+)-exporting diphosphatase n=1 Tax=Artemisia annua TaxID=35608 RepID=A0A2U1MD63_ARTAN|nr:nucleoporin, Nup133/Nup155-like protein [Artemisia annua]